MIYTECQEDFPIIAGPDRSSGLHVSDIYGSIMKEVFHEPDYDDNDLWAEGGFVWEELLGIAFKEYCRRNPKLTKNRIIFRPGEVELDGVIMSPDGIDCTPEGLLLEEYKVAWHSARKSPADVWKWQAQIKSYLKALELTKCRMRIFYMNGFYDYKKEFSKHPFTPHYRVCILEYTQYELNENWSMIKAHAIAKGWL